MSRKMSKYLSRKLKFISVFAMAAVVLLHSYNYADDFLMPTTRISEGFKAAPMVEYFFSNMMCRYAVPLFFIISGFLFYRTYKNTVKGYLLKLKKRAYSLLMPYLIWSALSGMLITILAQFSLFNSLDIVKERALDWSQFYLYLLNPPAFPLWFVQQLMMYAILSPIIYLLLKYTRGFIMIVPAVLWAMDYNFIINFSGLFFFCVGACFAIFEKDRSYAYTDNRLLTVIFGLIWVGLSLVNTFIAALGDKDSAVISVTMQTISKLNECVGVIANWYIFDHIAKRITDKKGFIIAATHIFFVYAMHEPLLHLCWQFALRQSDNTLGHLALYFCLPLSLSAVCVAVSMAFRKNFRKAHSLFTGGRQ